MTDPYTRAPHRREQPQGSSPNAALLIDFDNVTMAMRSNLGQELRNFLNSDIIRGKVSVQRAYADWRRYPQYIVPLSEASIDLIFAPAYGSSKKNATDIRMAIDALEIVFTRPEIGTYILLSGDSDFSSLVLKLKEYGKYVIGVGLQESSSDLLVQNCDEYYSYNSLSGLTSAEELTSQSHDPWELVEKAVRRMEERSDVMRSDRLKQVMLEIDQGFDEKDHGFSKFNRFLADAASRGLIRLRKMGDGQYEVAPVEARRRESSEDGGRPEKAEKPSKTDDGGRRGRPSGRERGGREQRSRKEPSRPPEIEAATLKSGYDLLRTVVKDLSGDGEPVRDSEVKREMLRRDERFDEAALGFSKFSRFLRQARDEEVVDLETDDDGNYHLSPPGSGLTLGPAEEPSDRAEAEAAPEPEPSREPPSQPSERPEPSAAPEATRQPEEEPAAPAGEAEEAPEAESAEPEPSPSEGRRRRGGLGRYRRGSRSGGAPTSEGDSGGAPGPVDAPSASEEPDEEESSDTPAAAEATKSTSGRRPARSSLSRFRRGQKRQPDRDEDAEEGASGPESEESSTAAAGTSDGDGAAAPSADRAAGVPEEPVEHMVTSWPGVGRKTAEKLVEAFGGDVFRIIDEEPDRLNDVLPEHRAHAVTEARQAERERVGS